MERKTIFKINAVYRDAFRVDGFYFGEGERSVAVMGSLRGNEMQQLYISSRLVDEFRTAEQEGRIVPGHQILIVPCGNPYSMNIKKRFWTNDNTDINRMFPGYAFGETTQRIAAGIFEELKDYRYGIQFASFYMIGSFVPHVRMMKTGLEDVALAKEFGLPYVVLHDPRPFDTSTLNYNWQIWETDAFSIYSTSTQDVDRASAAQSVQAVLRFLYRRGILLPPEGKTDPGVRNPSIIETSHTVNIRTHCAGFDEWLVQAGDHVKKGTPVARITDPFTGDLKEELIAPTDGVIFFEQDVTMVYQNTAVVKLIPDGAGA